RLGPTTPQIGRRVVSDEGARPRDCQRTHISHLIFCAIIRSTRTICQQDAVCLAGRTDMKNNFAIEMAAVAYAVGLVLYLSPASARAQANLVVNGSFEAGPAGKGQFTDWGWLGPADNFSNYGVAQSSNY